MNCRHLDTSKLEKPHIVSLLANLNNRKPSALSKCQYATFSDILLFVSSYCADVVIPVFGTYQLLYSLNIYSSLHVEKMYRIYLVEA